jgi:hypothetical protein
MRKIISIALALVGLALPAQAGMDWATGPSIYDEEGKREWSVEVTPYLFLASLRGDIKLPNTPKLPIDESFHFLVENLDGAFAGVADLRYRRWHLISDNSWVRLKLKPDTSDIGSVDSAVLETTLAFGTAALAYELPLKKDFAVDVYLAARWWVGKNDAEIDFAGPGDPVEGSTKEVWANAIVGTRIRYKITESWHVSAVADIGGGAASLDWSLFGSFGYQFNRYVGVTAGYRILGVDYSNNGSVYDIKESGLQLGLRLTY